MAVDRAALVADLKTRVGLLEDDLADRCADVPEFDAALREEWTAARDAKRTAAGYGPWRAERLTQAGVGWVLATVFVRFCEDNRLLALPYLAGPVTDDRGDARLAVAGERQAAYFGAHPERTDRDWIEEAIAELAGSSRVAAGLFDRAHNPMWQVTPSHQAAKRLIEFWRRLGEDAEIVHDFTDPTWSTRFLGDLYQDLSQHARDTYALLQTPEFVEEFILHLTLEPAIEEFGLEPEGPDGSVGLRLIDPTCGSGHFLLGAFHRLLEKWERAAPGRDRWELIARALGSVHGVDKNPFAVAIARFRLLIAAMQAGGVRSLADLRQEFVINVAVGDSLLHGRGGPGIQTEMSLDEEADDRPTHTYETEDVDEYVKSCDILGIGSYHVVVGNPPYITVKDGRENRNYRDGYLSSSGQYALSVPFAERFFHLARIAGLDRRGSGYVGQITANSFMKREFGKKLIEEFFAQKVNLTYVVDTSGAYIPGHGTPTVILVGRRYFPKMDQSVRAVLGVRGEPSTPADPAQGLVWRSIVDTIDRPDADTEWVTVADLERQRFAKHPWSLSGGGASELVQALSARASKTLGEIIWVIGRTMHTGSDETYFAPPGTWVRHGVASDRAISIVEGEVVRDWSLTPITEALFPYGPELRADLSDESSAKHLWMHRTRLRLRREPGGTHEEIGLTWYEWSRWHPDRFRASLGIAFAEVATHNNFALNRGGKVFAQTAPVIKLGERGSEDDHLALLGVLNSSTGCFWLNQVCHPKGGSGIGRGVQDEAWEQRHQYNGTRVEQFPLPAELPLELARELDSLAQRLAALEPAGVCADGVPTRERLDAASTEHARVRGRMIALQEKLDWETYRLYGLLDDAEAREVCADPGNVPELNLGERAFEIVLARKKQAGEAETQWFARHGSTPITELPAHWPEPYREIVANRIATIEGRRDIALIERPECKRRWSSEPWEKKKKAALRGWLLDRCEARDLWYAPDEWGQDQPRAMTVNRLADRLRGNRDVVAVARLYAGDPDADLAQVIADIIDAGHVPYLAQLRYKPSGLTKRRQWEDVWGKQREEDRTGARLDIDVPPKYTSGDFARPSYWRNRGKLDVPKERFISYPSANPEGDPSLLLGWAGWDHREQAHALMTLIEERTTRDGWDTNRLTPLIAGLAEVLPWVWQWHGEIDPQYGASPADAYAGYLDDQRHRHQLTDDDLRTWRPAQRRTRRQTG